MYPKAKWFRQGRTGWRTDGWMTFEFQYISPFWGLCQRWGGLITILLCESYQSCSLCLPMYTSCNVTSARLFLILKEHSENIFRRVRADSSHFYSTLLWREGCWSTRLNRQYVVFELDLFILQDFFSDWNYVQYFSTPFRISRHTYTDY